LEKARALMGKPCKAARYGDALSDGQRRFFGALDLLDAGRKAGASPEELGPLGDFLAHHLDQWSRVLEAYLQDEAERGFWRLAEVEWARARCAWAAHNLRFGWRPLYGRPGLAGVDEPPSAQPQLHPMRADWALLRGLALQDPPPDGAPWCAPEGVPPERVEFLSLSGAGTLAQRGAELPRWPRLKGVETRYAGLSAQGLARFLECLPERGLAWFEMEAAEWGEEELGRLAACEALGGVRSVGFGWGSWRKEGVAALAKAPWLASVERLSVPSMSRSAGATLELLQRGDWAKLKVLELDSTALTPKQLDALVGCLEGRGLELLTLRWSQLPQGAQRRLASAQGLAGARIFLNHSPLRRERWLLA
jgi:hypothetical protein